MEVPRNIVGPQVMKLRDGRSLSQNDLAIACQLAGWDVSRGVIARIESGVRWVADWELIELAKALKVSVPELYPEAAQAYFQRNEPLK